MEWKEYEDSKFEELKGEIISSIEGLTVGSEEAIFTLKSGKRARLVYHRDCCASCSIEDICGDPADLTGTPILLAELVTSEEKPAGVKTEELDYSNTWSFYKLSTIKGSVTIRWYGSSNGYYSEEADFEWEGK